MEPLANVCPFPFVPISIFWGDNPWTVVGWAISISLTIVFFGLTCFGRNRQKYRDRHFRLLAVFSLIVAYVFSAKTDWAASEERARRDREQIENLNSKPKG